MQWFLNLKAHWEWQNTHDFNLFYWKIFPARASNFSTNVFKSEFENTNLDSWFLILGGEGGRFSQRIGEGGGGARPLLATLPSFFLVKYFIHEFKFFGNSHFFPNIWLLLSNNQLFLRNLWLIFCNLRWKSWKPCEYFHILWLPHLSIEWLPYHKEFEGV